MGTVGVLCPPFNALPLTARLLHVTRAAKTPLRARGPVEAFTVDAAPPASGMREGVTQVARGHLNRHGGRSRLAVQAAVQAPD